MEEPYLVPYLPVTPTFLVRFAIITQYIKLIIKIINIGKVSYLERHERNWRIGAHCS